MFLYYRAEIIAALVGGEYMGGVMKRVIGVIALVWVGLSVAADAPKYYGPLQGVVASGLTERSEFRFTPGTLSACTKNDAGTIVGHTCVVTGAKATVVGANGKTLDVKFGPKLWGGYIQHSSGFYQEYRLTGEYTETVGGTALPRTAELILWNYFNSPEDIKGSLRLVELGVVGGIQASPQR